MRQLALVPSLVLAVCFVSASELHALANRVFVSARSGSDANTCDNILAPCQTFAGAVTKLNPGGEAIVLDSGGYGPVTITQALTIEAPAGVTAFIHASSGDAITVNAGASDSVVLRGLVLNGGPGNGITVNQARSLAVENCAVSGFADRGIVMASPGGVLSLKNTDVKGSANVGVDIANTSGVVTVSIDHCHFDGNAEGFRVAAASPGSTLIAATNSTANNNTSAGWVVLGSGFADVSLESCSGSGNALFYGFSISNTNPATEVFYSNCIFSNNGVNGVHQTSGLTRSRGNNTLTGNPSGSTSGVIGTFGPG